MAHKEKVRRVGLYCIDRVSSGVLHGRGQAGALNTSMVRAGQVLWESMCVTLDSREKSGKLAKGARGRGSRSVRNRGKLSYKQ